MGEVVSPAARSPSVPPSPPSGESPSPFPFPLPSVRGQRRVAAGRTELERFYHFIRHYPAFSRLLPFRI